MTENKNAFNIIIDDNAQKVRPRVRWAETTPLFGVTGQLFLNRYFSVIHHLALSTFVYICSQRSFCTENGKSTVFETGKSRQASALELLWDIV